MELMRYFSLAALAALVGLGSSIGSITKGALAQAQGECTVTVQPGQSIQGAIDQAQEGAVICLAEGTWEENIKIGKGLVLRGLGVDEEVRIVGAEEGYPVIRIESDSEIEVTLENLTVAEAKGWPCAEYDPQQICPDGIEARGKARVTITSSTVSSNRYNGLDVRDSTQLVLRNSTVSDNVDDGLSVYNSARVTLSNVEVSGHFNNGLSVGGSAEVEITDSVIKDNRGNVHVGGGLLVSDSATVRLTNSKVFNNYEGLVLFEEARVTLTNSEVSESQVFGVEMWGSSTAIFINSRISDNPSGLVYMDADSSGTVTFQNSQVSGNGLGIGVSGQPRITLKDSQVSDNAYNGLRVMGGSAQVTLQDSQVSGNGWNGLWVSVSARVTVEGSLIEGNGTDENCQDPGPKPWEICNGIGVSGEEAQVELINSQVLGNADWGVGAVLKQCGYDEDDFTGQVSFEGMELEDISGNNTSGNQDGMGNPGNHPWNRPEVPDGQVCLP